ncbi:MAG: NADP-dependent oxidoreductase [Robiginitomaculum sp.]|nr:MAG: NADP-dependent oxidoreductase [Robiginitomaculum sp.]
MTITSRNMCLKQYPKGTPTSDDFLMTTTEIKPAGKGEITVQNHWMSVDPYMRGRMTGIKTYIAPFELGQPMEGGAVGQITHSGHPDYKVGDWIMTMLGWRETFTAPVDTLKKSMLQKLDVNMIPAQAFLGVAGMPGLTAYAGLYKVGEYKSGETVLVSGAAGAVGSTVCQLAKADGATVIGLAGSDEKCKWLESHGVDHAINYKTAGNLTKAIKKAAPQGIDVYFENVGGDMLEAALNNMNMFGRIAACGMISQYNNEAPTPGPNNLVMIIGKSLKLQGFIVSNHQDCAPEYFSKLGPLMASGKLVQQETILEGIENAGEAFMRLFDGNKQGKMLVKLT